MASAPSSTSPREARGPRPGFEHQRRTDHDRGQQCGVEQQKSDQAPQARADGFSIRHLAQLFDPAAVKRGQCLQPVGQGVVQRDRGAPRRAHHPGRAEGGQRRDHDRHRIKRLVGGAAGQTDPGDDERKLADLRQAHPGLYGDAHAVPGEEGPERDADHLADHHHQQQHHHRARVVKDEARIDRHSHGHEEDGREHVPHRPDQ
jgi:hypothetical protein